MNFNYKKILHRILSKKKSYDLHYIIKAYFNYKILQSKKKVQQLLSKQSPLQRFSYFKYFFFTIKNDFCINVSPKALKTV